jgi:CheY-like chemotaxis protein/anti-sigma regulatory factor (Ser/Thr protein kinase)
MARVLIVDDSEIDRMIAEEILGKDEEIETTSVSGGAAAMASIRADLPDLVLTDLMMPEMNGLQVVAAVRENFPALPVILMTSQGSEEIAVRALREGAQSYVPKQRLAKSLLSTVKEILDLAVRRRAKKTALASLQQSDSTFKIDNRQELVRPLVNHLQDTMALMGLCDEAERMQVGVALTEAMNNALEHGNLEVNSAVREDDLDAYFEQMRERSGQEPYRDRRIHVEASLDRDSARFVIRDEGPGFDPSLLPDPRDPANLDRLSGRGVLLIRLFMDEVLFNDEGNEVTMVKHGPVPEELLDV